jgi:5-formyltetrahydrofolate cyclo-ligase
MLEHSPDSAPAATPDSKPVLRRKFLACRKALAPAEIATCGERLRAQAADSAALPEIARLGRGHTLAAYVSMGSEIPTLPLLGDVLARGARLLVPRLGTGRQIGWSYMDATDELASPGTRRPDEPAAAPVLGLDALAAADVILVPAFFIDEEGFRLGRGAGWYDRALTHRSASAAIIGVVYPWETSARNRAAATDRAAATTPLPRALPRDPHDVPVDIVLTPDDVTRLRD